MEIEAQVQRCFLQLRAEGLVLGIEELLDALKLAKAVSRSELLPLLEMLWCKSLDDHIYFKSAWESSQEEIESEPSFNDDEAFEFSNKDNNSLDLTGSIPRQIENENRVTISILPLFAPNRAISANYTEFKNYYPVSRRFMAYSWHHLRRYKSDGPFNQLDFERTVEIVTRQGFYLMPAYRRAKVNHAHLVLLLDQGGSMTPFHHYLRDIVDTACYESSLAQVDVYYFHNVPEETLYLDPHLTQRISLSNVIESIDENTSILIISDAGAARHRNNPLRIIITAEFLNNIKNVTESISWLNPMPKERWQNTSAEEIKQFVHMFSMNEDGLIQAVDVLRGL